MSSLTATELVNMGLALLAEIFDLPVDHIRRDLVASRAINWGDDPFARGAYSYATPKTREAQSVLKKPDGGVIFFPARRSMPAPIWARSRRRWRADKKQRRRETAQTIVAAGP